ncbi:MAG: ABC transporter ATP-binding protein [Fibrobacterales bacterium]
MIKIKNLSYAYPGQLALKSLYCEIKAGTITAVVGPNGAGKSTLFKCITTLQKPLQGTIFINGLDVVTHPRECKKLIGYLPDTFGLYEKLTVNQVLTYFARAHGFSKQECESRVSEMVARLNLVDKCDKLCGSLSRGMRQRVAIGQAMIHSPALLVLDEPASGLDPEARHELAQLFIRLKEEGVTLLISSHILAELDQYADDLLVLRGGELVNQKAQSLSHNQVSVDESVAEERLLTFKVLSQPDTVSQLLSTNTYVPQSHDGTILSILSRVSEVTCEGNEVKAVLKGTEEDQCALIRFLVQEGCTVSECYTEKQNLQETYLTMVKEHDAK